MVKDEQVERLMKELAKGRAQKTAAHMAGMSERTARRYVKLGGLPSEVAVPHTWRTRDDPFEAVWPEAEALLAGAPGLQAKTVFEELQRRYPGRFGAGQMRTLQRRVKEWRALHGPEKEVMFAQVHELGRLGASDFTSGNDLGVMIGGRPYPHLLYHFVLTRSNWEYAQVAYSENFEALSEGLQNALGAAGGAPRRHRSDNLSAAVSDPGREKQWTGRYAALLRHYGMEPEATNAGKGHENGDVEKSNDLFKKALKQKLLLRGSGAFESEEAYEAFVKETARERNQQRATQFEEEHTRLRPLPARRQEAWRERQARVGAGSTISVAGNVYSVPSRLIDERVTVRLLARQIEVWYGGRCIERMERVRGRGRHRINWRHMVTWLERKPGAFERYRYAEEMFPTTWFRRAYDALCGHGRHGTREYLGVLKLAAEEAMERVNEALEALLSAGTLPTEAAVRERLAVAPEEQPTVQVTVAMINLAVYDTLFTTRVGEVSHAGA